MFDKPHEECGVFGIYNKNQFNAVHLTYLALYALQHRGQISCGIAINRGGVVDYHRDLGIVPDVFDADALQKLSQDGGGDICIGHVRYSPGGMSERENSQPLVMRYAKGTIAIANNGSLVNTHALREPLEKQGAIFQTDSDAELIALLIARARLEAGSVEQAINRAMNQIEGAYSFVLMSPRKMIAVRDPQGFRPLCIGKMEDSYIFASETCALDSLGAEFVRDIEPGEIVVADENGIRSIRDHCGHKSSLCIFEHVYFARPDSVIDNASVHLARQRAGKYLAREYPVEADLVAGVAEGCVQAGCALIGGETAEMPGFYPKEEYDLAGFCVGMADKAKLIDGAQMKAGDALIGVSSSGVHSNGFSLVRKVFNITPERLNLYMYEFGKTLGEELLTPTRIYVKSLLALMEQVEVHGVSHITGGGFYENIPRMLPDYLRAAIEKAKVPVRPIFKVIQSEGISEHDMYNTFNMGVGLCVAVAADQADEAVRILKENGEEACILGEVREGEKGIDLC